MTLLNPPAASPDLRARVDIAFDEVFEAIQERTITRTFGDRILGYIAAIRSGLDAAPAQQALDALRAARDAAFDNRDWPASAGRGVVVIPDGYWNDLSEAVDAALRESSTS